MLSKVLRKPEPYRVTPVQWPERSKSALRPTADAPPCAGSDPAAPALLARIQELEQQLVQVQHEAHRTGWEQGYAAAKGKLESEMAPLLEGVSRATGQLREIQREYIRDSEQNLLHLSLAIARRVLHREVTVDPDALAGIATAALNKLRGQQVIRIRVHPNLHAPLKRAMEGSDEPELEIVQDARAGAAGILFETKRGDLDLGIDTQLEEIERGLADALPR